MAFSYFNELRLISRDVTSATIGSPHYVEAVDNNGQHYNLSPRQLLSETLIADSTTDNRSYEIPLEAFSQAQLTRIFQIFNNVDNTDNIFYSNFSPEQNNRFDTLFDMIRNDFSEYNWGDTHYHSHSQISSHSPSSISATFPDPTPTPTLTAETIDMPIPPTDFLEPVKSVLSVYNFKRICGVKNSKGKQIFRKWGPPLMKDMGITEATCSICLGDIEKWEKIAITPCKHVFHKKCAEKWFCKECVHPTCPSCRHDITE